MRPLTATDPEPKPFVYTTPSGRVITWPDPMEWDVSQAASWMHHLSQAPVAGLFGALPDHADREALARVSTAEAKTLAAQVLAHYSTCWASPEDLAYLGWVLLRHPGPILWELTPRGVDVRAWLAQRRWSDLVLMLEELPPVSALSEATQNDPEWVEQQVTSETDAGGIDTSSQGWRPRLRDYDLVSQQLGDISARLDALYVAELQVAHNVAYHGAKSAPSFSAPKTKPFPAPRTLLDVRRDEIVAAETWALYDLFQPSRSTTTPPGGTDHVQDEEAEDDDRL